MWRFGDFSENFYKDSEKSPKRNKHAFYLKTVVLSQQWEPVVWKIDMPQQMFQYLQYKLIFQQ